LKIIKKIDKKVIDMGLEIQYKLEFKGTEDELKATIDEIRSFLDDMEIYISPVYEITIAGQVKDFVTSKVKDEKDLERKQFLMGLPDTGDGGKKIVPVARCIGFIGGVGEGCEWFTLALANSVNDENKWKSGLITVKTQYARHFIKAHVTTCLVLDLFKECGIKVIDIEDEGYYYKKRSFKLLEKRVEECDAFVMETARKYGASDTSLSRRFLDKNVDIEDDVDDASPVE
jgi:hypothetical protein